MSYTDRIWSDEARAELQAKIEQLNEDDLRTLLLTVTSEPDPSLVLSTLRGAAFGLAARRERIEREAPRRAVNMLEHR